MLKEIIFKTEIQIKTEEIINLKAQNKKNIEALNHLECAFNERINNLDAKLVNSNVKE